MSAREVLGLEPRPLVVPEDQEMVLSLRNGANGAPGAAQLLQIA
jgi:hypothetical protein